MTNSEIVDTFERIANLLEIKGEIIYKILAYRHAAESIRLQTSELATMSEKDILAIPGVGQAIAEKIQELLTTGKLDFLQKLEKEVPPGLIELLNVQDLGPKKAAIFWKQAGITNMELLESAAQAGKLRTLPGMGEKSEARILTGIKALKEVKKRFPIAKALVIADEWLGKLRQIRELYKVEAAGSLRRWKTSIGDLDFVGASDQPKEVMQKFVSLPGIERILSQGENKTSVQVSDGLNVQLWLQPSERFGSLLQFVTGSKEHNVKLREFSLKQGLSLSERGFISNNLKETVCPEEEIVYHTLGLPWIAPELREDRGELQAALNHSLPDLISIEDIQSDLHTHSDWSDGRSSIEVMIQVAIHRGLKVLAITDHSQRTLNVRGLDFRLLNEQRKEIQKLQGKYGNSITLLQGIEMEILESGQLDLPDEILAELDIVVASLHDHLEQPRQTITDRLLKVIRNQNVDIIAHPSGRELPQSNGADLDWEKVYQAARENQVALEINCNPVHLDLDEIHARAAVEKGVLLTIDTDSHSAHQLDNMKFGVAVARRGWVNKNSVINSWSSQKLLDWLKNRK